MTNSLILIIPLVLAICSISQACIGSGCVHDRERDQFFWCSGNADKELPAIKAYYGGVVNQQSYSSYCTGVSAMLVTTDPSLISIAEKNCGNSGHESCQENLALLVMSEPRFRSRDPNCSRPSSLNTAGGEKDRSSPPHPASGGDKEDRPSPHPSKPPAKLARSCPVSILLLEKSPEKEYDPESPISDINLSSSPVLHSPAPEQHSSPAEYSSPVPSSFLVCAVCGTTPSSIPLHGCELSHII